MTTQGGFGIHLGLGVLSRADKRKKAGGIEWNTVWDSRCSALPSAMMHVPDVETKTRCRRFIYS